MTALLSGHIHSLLEGPWGRAGRLDRREVEDAIDLGLALLEAIRRIDLRATSRMHTGGSAADRLAVEEACRLYESWYGRAADMLTAVEAAEARGEYIANAADFRVACNSSHFEGFEPEALQRAAQQFSQGSGRPLGEVLDAVRRRTVR